MKHIELCEKLLNSLSVQLNIYEQINDLQSQLLQKLDSSNAMAEAMDLLNEKNILLDKVKNEHAQNAPVVNEWIENKSEMSVNFPMESAKIDDIIGEIENLVLKLRSQDEAMIQRFDQHSQTQNRLNAMRALR
ncbi:hypothetical protein AGMMS49938_02190 [Fibrobacterales bacterium]|nr:hypothetical protein AGMMS49938_02190 [Fibrobacterales bacterium]